jgi:hypothetical protein
MFIRSNLFSKGHPLKAEPGLSDALDAHKRTIINKIKAITDLDQMTDAFCQRIVKEGLIAPLVLHFDQMIRQTRTEQIDGSLFPGDFNVERGRYYPKTVVRIVVPFSGEGDLLKYSPSTAGLTFPRGEVSGDKIRFDILLWGYSDDATRVKHDLESNRHLLETCASTVTMQVRQFNEALAPQIKAAFAAKLDELTKQHAIFDDLGIPEQSESMGLAGSSAPKPKKGKARADQINIYVETMLVETLNQTNNNTGNVNNAIQSNE